MTRPTKILLDPVTAYDRAAPFFADLSARRSKYLRSIETLIVSRLTPGSRSLLDVGAGDGQRAERIEHGGCLTDVVLLEPSAEMRKRIRCHPSEIWTIRAEELDERRPPANSRQFDLITCLWNVLGHVHSSMRVQVLRGLGRLLTHQGRLFVDVTHRYNAASYGLVKTSARWVRDMAHPREGNGDVEVQWNLKSGTCTTHGHVFTRNEMSRFAQQAELRTLERVVVDYDTGEIKPFGFQGNLLYIFCRESSSSDSFNIRQTLSI